MSYLKLENIEKSFPGVKALRQVSFEAHAGQVHGLLGENGAGKSTLLKILGGQYRPDAGQILIDGQAVRFSSAADSIAAGVAIIHQELQYVPELTVTENILLGHLPSRLGFIRHSAAKRFVSQRLTELGVELDPAAKLADLSIAQRQMAEICKAVLQDARIIAFDEPTSSLSHKETEVLFRIIRQLKQQGKVIIYISHRLDELYALCDACTIFRDGSRVASHWQMAQVPREQLIQDMVGRELRDIYDYQSRPHGAPLLSVEQVCGARIPTPLSFELARGEIIGFFGLVGAGRTELMRLIYGADQRSGGKVSLNNRLIPANSPHLAIRAGMVLCPEDRKEQGILAEASIAENINISSRRHYLWSNFFLNHRREASIADQLIARLRVKTPDRHQAISNLSGGNQQKVILARWLSEPGLQLMILDEPTRGIDVGAKNEIYQIIYEVARSGCGVIVISSELPEVLGICDRIFVMRDGRISGQLSRAEANETTVLALALPDGVATHATDGHVAQSPTASHPEAGPSDLQFVKTNQADATEAQRKIA